MEFTHIPLVKHAKIKNFKGTREEIVNKEEYVIGTKQEGFLSFNLISQA
jgi:hypothetical protein